MSAFSFDTLVPNENATRYTQQPKVLQSQSLNHSQPRRPSEHSETPFPAPPRKSYDQNPSFLPMTMDRNQNNNNNDNAHSIPERPLPTTNTPVGGTWVLVFGWSSSSAPTAVLQFFSQFGTIVRKRGPHHNYMLLQYSTPLEAQLAASTRYIELDDMAFVGCHRLQQTDPLLVRPMPSLKSPVPNALEPSTTSTTSTSFPDEHLLLRPTTTDSDSQQQIKHQTFSWVGSFLRWMLSISDAD